MQKFRKNDWIPRKRLDRRTEGRKERQSLIYGNLLYVPFYMLKVNYTGAENGDKFIPS